MAEEPGLAKGPTDSGDLFSGNTLKIYTYPHPILKKVATPVDQFDESLKELVRNMLTTMYLAPGVGLAGPQVGQSKRLFVMDIDYSREKIEGQEGKYTYKGLNPKVIINPVFTEKTGEILYEEGCLSVPGIYEKVQRAQVVKLTYQDVDGQTHSLEAEGLRAVCLQHETDHLDGIVFLERLSFMKRELLVKKLLKAK